MGDGKLRLAVRVNPLGRIRYGEEHCKVALLLSALLIVPLRDIVVMCFLPHLPLVFARGVGYGLLGTVFSLFFCIPFLCRLQCRSDMFLLGGFILLELLLFGIRRPGEINAVYMLLIAKSMLMAFPYYIIARSLKDYGMLERALYRFSFVINFLVFAVMRYRIEVDGGYSMGAAYAVLPGAMVAFRMLLRQSSILSLINVVISLVVLVFCGTRGPVVCYVLFCVYEMTANRAMAKEGAIKKVLTGCIAGLVLLMAGMFPFGDVGAIWSSNRFVHAARNNYLFRTRDREVLWQAAWETLSEHPLTGVGLLEDRLQIFRRADLPPQDKARGYAGDYSHFVFLDWLLEYGVVVGLLSSLLAFFSVYRFFSMPYSIHKSCMEIFFFRGCVPLLFSGIWHESQWGYIFLGMLISMAKDRHNVTLRCCN